MINEQTKARVRFGLEREIYNTIDSVCECHSAEVMLFVLQEYPSILNEVVKKHADKIEEALKKGPY
jgi:hypothetical protein